MTLPDYVRSFDPEDRERVFRFLAIFARYECALKRSGFVRRGSHGEADANWNTYADHISTRLARLTSQEYVTARDSILGKPPLRECLYNGRIQWLPNPRRKGETDTRYLLRVVRDVRNNLFHGGKFQNDESKELARDRLLIDSAIIVLQASAGAHDSIRRFFYG